MSMFHFDNGVYINPREISEIKRVPDSRIVWVIMTNGNRHAREFIDEPDSEIAQYVRHLCGKVDAATIPLNVVTYGGEIQNPDGTS